MSSRFLGLIVLILFMVLTQQDANAARRSLRIDFGAWFEALPFTDSRCEGGFENGLDIVWRGHQFSASASPEYTADTYCQKPGSYSELDPQDTTEYLNQEIFGPDEAGLAAMIGSNDSDDYSARVTALRYTFLNQDRFSENPLPEGFQWGFYFFPNEITLVTLYGDIPVGSNGFEPFIYNHYGTVWDSRVEGYDGEYFCFEGGLFIGTWDGILHEAGEKSRCELLLGELIFDSGFENRPLLNGNGFYNDESGSIGEQWPTFSDGFEIVEYPRFLADFNGDGLPDLVMERDDVDNIYLNSGDPSDSQMRRPFRFAAQLGFDCDIGCDVKAVGDMDGSGTPDLVLGIAGEANQLLLNNGSENPFEGVARLNIGGVAAPGQMVVGDVDNDGNLDLASFSYGETIQLYMNNGSADPFAGVAPIEIDMGPSWTAPESVSFLSLIDINADGNKDIFYLGGSFAFKTPAMFLNNGTSNPFTDVIAVEFENIPDPDFLRLGDMNADGYVDLVVQPGVDKTILIYLNNGTSTPFSGVTGQLVYTGHENDNYITFDLGDVDGDGNLDLAVASDYLPHRLFLNNGTADPFAGVRGLYITGESPDIGNYFLLGHIDDDGKADLIVGGVPDARTYLNQD